MSKHPGQDGSLAGRFPAGVAAAAGSGTEQEAEGGEPACWAHLVCPECGAITSEGHRQGCGFAPGTARKG
jgi:hypothetical protein